jgi:dTDP-4-amino-4,6-dideoxygalactose transaminase
MKYAIPVNRGRVGIEIALRAMQLNENDEVIIPSYICHTVLDAVLKAGTRPVFADVGPDLHLTPETVKKAITPKTKCVIVPHLFGNIAAIDKIEEMLKGTEIALIDDAAQSFGAKCSGRLVGTFGDCGIVSCGPGKRLQGLQVVCSLPTMTTFMLGFLQFN